MPKFFGIVAALATGVIIIPAPTGKACSQTIDPIKSVGSRIDLSAVEDSPYASSHAMLSFTPSIERRRANLRQFVAKTRAADPAGAARLETLFAQGDIVEIIGQGLAPYGLRIDNLADAYAMWWVNAWQAWAGDTSDTTRAQAAAVRAQAAAAMLRTDALATASDAQKQEFAEALLVQAALVGASTEQLETDPSLKAPLRAAMTSASKVMGVDFSRMILTKSGFQAANASSPPRVATDRTTTASRSPAVGGRTAASEKGVVWAGADLVVFTMGGDMQYHPTVLFNDGNSYDIDDASLETMSVASSKATEPALWGTWKRTGIRYHFVGSGGGTSDYELGDGGLYRSFPATPGMTLDARYKSVSGSTTGEMSMLSTRGIRFRPDGRFDQDSSFAASGSGDVSGVSSAGGSQSQFRGTYRIDHHRIVLTFDDGRVLDRFFGFGSGGKPPTPDRELIFIGGTNYVTDD